MRQVIVPFFIVHQGCPHRCVFCNQSKISGGTEALPTPAEIVGTIDTYRHSAKRSSVAVAFYGGTFTSLPRLLQERLLLPLQPLVADGTVSGIRVSTRPDAVNEDTASFLRAMKVTVVELGAQSFDDEVLLRSGRGHAAGDISAACRILREKHFQVGIQLMTGLPCDTFGKSMASLKQALQLRPDFLRIYPALVIAGTQLERLYRRSEYAPQTLEEAVDLCKEMLRMAREAGVPVIRLGLQPTEELETPGTVVAGPYHPAFRQLVESELCYEALSSLTAGMSGPVTVRCAPGRISDVAGQRRRNIKRLASERGVTIAAIRGDELLSPLELRIEAASTSMEV